MATGKQYVDLEGLTTFSTSLKNKLAANTLNDWVVNYASNAGQATSDGNGANIADTYLTQTDATATYVPLTRTITSLALSTDITAEALRTQLNVEDGSEKNIIESITIDNVPQNPDGDRKVALDLSNYAKKSDITAVLKFKGVVSDVSALPEASKDQVGHVYIVASGKEGDAYAEYVCVDNNGETEGGYAWEKLGNGASLDGYYTQEEINAKFNALSLASTGADGSFISTVSQTAGKVSASTTAFATSVAENGKVAPTSGAVYTAIEGAKSALIGTGAGDSGSTIKKNEAAIKTLNGADTVEGSVDKKIKDAIGGLTGTQNEGDYVTSVTQADGKVSVTRASKGSVADGNTGLVDGGTVHSFVTTHVTNAIQGLDVTAVGGDGSFLSAISEADGMISATVQTLDATIPDSNPSTVVAPTTSAFKDYSDSVYVAISSVSSEEISQLFIPKSKTRDLITGTTEVAESDIVTKIGDNAFFKYSTLTSVSFPNAKSIGTYAFSDCTGLTEVSIPNATSIGGNAFSDCSSLTKVSIPNATSIGGSAFGGCSKLTEVSFPVATSIGMCAFQDCSSLAKVSFPNATSIGISAFRSCKGLTEVSFPNATRIDASAFNSCSGLINVSIPNATSIDDSAFNGCSKLTSVSFPVATSIGNNAFQNCSGLTEVSIPKAISIGNFAFQSCSSLTSVSFPVATSIGDSAFNRCSGLTKITDASFPEVTSIGREAFQNCSSLTSVSFPNATSIGQSAFNGCSKLTSVSFPNNVKSIGLAAFSSSGLTEASFPEVTKIGGNAFDGCSNLTKVSIPNATSIGVYVFRNCNSLTSVSFPVATSILEYAFYNCSSLTKITDASFPEVKSIGYCAFQNCSSLTSVSFPVATSIGRSAFSGCSKLTSVSFPLATSIGLAAFSSSGLTEASFPEVTKIGDSAFSECTGLPSVSFPNATSIGSGAFNGCSKLTTIYVGTNISTVCTLSNTDAFLGCTNLTNIYVPESLVDSYKLATNWSSYADKIKAYEQPVECISLSITADDVIGNATSTTVYYTAECTYTKGGILQEGTMVFTGEVTSDSFEQNTSMTDTVQREVSFTFLGQTATTTITQGVWVNQSITVTTEGNYGWVTADNTYNVDGYDVYMSNNKGVDNSNAVMKLKCIGYTELTIYIRSYAESSYDYTIASNANVSNYPTSYDSSDTKAHTSGNQKSGTTIRDYTKVEYTGLSGNDTIYIVFTKDDSGADDDDRGYVLIPKQS